MEEKETRDRLADFLFFFLREINPVNLNERCLRVLQGTFRVDSTHPNSLFP